MTRFRGFIIYACFSCSANSDRGGLILLIFNFKKNTHFFFNSAIILHNIIKDIQKDRPLKLMPFLQNKFCSANAIFSKSVASNMEKPSTCNTFSM